VNWAVLECLGRREAQHFLEPWRWNIYTAIQWNRKIMSIIGRFLHTYLYVFSSIVDVKRKTEGSETVALRASFSDCVTHLMSPNFNFFTCKNNETKL
jgi:hypothetical protein